MWLIKSICMAVPEGAFGSGVDWHIRTLVLARERPGVFLNQNVPYSDPLLYPVQVSVRIMCSKWDCWHWNAERCLDWTQGRLRLDPGILGLYHVWSKLEHPREGKDSSTFIMAIYFPMHILTFAMAFKKSGVLLKSEYIWKFSKILLIHLYFEKCHCL